MSMIDIVAMYIGYFLMVPTAIIVVIFPVWVAVGYAGKNMYKRLRRIYSLNVVWYWLNRLESEGKRCFEKSDDAEDLK